MPLQIGKHHTGWKHFKWLRTVYFAYRQQPAKPLKSFLDMATVAVLVLVVGVNLLSLISNFCCRKIVLSTSCLELSFFFCGITSQ